MIKDSTGPATPTPEGSATAAPTEGMSKGGPPAAAGPLGTPRVPSPSAPRVEYNPGSEFSDVAKNDSAARQTKDDGGGKTESASESKSSAASEHESVAETETTPAPMAWRPQWIGRDFRVPYLYEVWADGLYIRDGHIREDHVDDGEDPQLESTPSHGRRMKLRRITDRPVWIEAFGNTIDTKEELVCVGFRRIEDNRDDSVWVARADLSDRKRLETLACVGLPVRTGNAKEVEAYLAKSIADNGPRFRWQTNAKRCGMYDVAGDRIGFLVGDQWIGPDPRVVMDPRNGNDLHTGFRVSGDPRAWLKKFAELRGVNSTCNFLLHASFVAPIMRLIRQRSFIIHHWGQSGGGKTALLRFCMSAWGHPIDLTSSFNSTSIGAVEIFGYVDNLPIAYDELQASTNKDHATLCYHFVQEKGRRRARPQGGLEAEVNTWRTVVRTTGEEPIVGNGKVDLGGQKNRVLEINAFALDSGTAREVHHWLEEGHHGAAGVRFIERLVEAVNSDSAFTRRLYDTYRAYALRLNEAVPGLDARADPFAAVALAGRLVGAWLFEEDPETYGDRVLKAAAEEARGMLEDEDKEDFVERALRMLRDHSTAQPSKWINQESEVGKQALLTKGYDGIMGLFAPSQNEVWLIPTQANRLLTRESVPWRRVWVDLRKQGDLAAQGTKRPFGLNANGSARWRSCYVLKLDRFLGDRD